MLTNNDLLVLSFLLERPMHGYEISQAIKTEDIEVWFEISTASVYYSLNKLRRDEMIAEARSRGSSGDKTIYHVTEYGREQFFAGVERLLASRQPIRTDYDLGIFMLNRVPQTRAAELLAQRIGFLDQWRTGLEHKRDSSEQRPLRKAILHHAIAAAHLDADWLAGIIQQLQVDDACETPLQSLMTLQGDLQDFHLPDLIKLIASGKHSGALIINTGSQTRTLLFSQGQPYCAISAAAGDSSHTPEQTIADIYDLFRWQQGTFVFDQRGCPQDDCVPLDVGPDDLILNGARRLENWEIIQHIVPSSEALFEPCDRQDQLDRLNLHDEESLILNIVDGFKDVTAMARESGLTEFETSKILYGLYTVGLVRPADPDKSRLRRVFREFAELMCRSAIPYRATPEEATLCEQEVNRRCSMLPVRIANSRIEDRTDATLQVDELATIYRTFLKTQHTVLSERLSPAIADELRQRVISRISPDLKETLAQYKLI